MIEVQGVQAKTNYEAVAVADGQTIFADKDGYFIFEHYPSVDGSYYALPFRLGKTAKEVEQTLTDMNDWNYRYWHGESEELNKASEVIKALPTIQ
jgi:hypothetical protein